MPATIDQERLEAFLHHAIGDFGGAMQTALGVIGEKLGLYKAMGDGAPVTPEELAQKTGTRERYVREWLASQAAGGYVRYDAASGRFHLDPEQCFALTDPDGLDMCGAFQLILSVMRDEPKLAEIFRTGNGFGWHEHDPALFLGTERFFKPTYAMNLVSEWIPALDGVEAKLRSGAQAADVGCGHGSSTIMMAKAFPQSKFVGFDYHEPSIATARQRAAGNGTNGNLRFEVATAKTFPGSNYDFIAFFDCLHDMGDPVGAARHVREALRPDGTWMIVEPLADDRLENNLNPIGRVFFGASTLVCTPVSLSQEVGLGLGAQAGQERLTRVLKEAGFSRVRRAAETPFNMILEARP
jgi:2-polyprenyl-3-methyl-5-hydroxy-6-metoxy-1,4-benzoquinol methylase